MFDLNTLKKAVSPLSQVGRDEDTFEINGVSLTLRPLLPLEEVAVQRYAASVMSDLKAQGDVSNTDQMSRAAALDYFDRFRIEVIAHAIVQIGDLDLRTVTAIPTGEFLENGVEVRVPKALAMREIVQSQWSRSMITIAFSRYGDLIQKVADQAEMVARTSLPDLDAEIERVERRLARLKEDRASRAAGDPSITTKQITALLQAGKALEDQAERAADIISAEAATQREQQREGRRPVVPPVVPPPGNAPVRPPPTTPINRPPPEVEFVSSFGDSPDGGPLEDDPQERIVAARKAAKAEGLRDGMEVFRLPTENLSGRGKTQPKVAPTVDVPPTAGNQNPNFRPPRR